MRKLYQCCKEEWHPKKTEEMNSQVIKSIFTVQSRRGGGWRGAQVLGDGGSNFSMEHDIFIMVRNWNGNGWQTQP